MSITLCLIISYHCVVKMFFTITDFYVKYERGEEWITKSFFVWCSQLLRGNKIPRVSWQNSQQQKVFVFCLMPLVNTLCFQRQEAHDGESTACKVAKNDAQQNLHMHVRISAQVSIICMKHQSCIKQNEEQLTA